MNVVHVVVGPGFAGTEKYVCDVANQCAALGHTVTVVGGDHTRMSVALRPGARWLPGGSVPEAMRSLLTVGRVDVVHAHMTEAETAAAAMRWRNRGLFACTRHFAARRGSNLASRALSPLLNHALDLQVAISHFVGAHLERAPDLVLHNGVTTSADVPEADQRRVLLLQRLSPEKDTATALRAWHRSGLGSRGWQLRVAGEGAERPRLEALSRRLGTTNSVVFLGFVDRPRAELERAEILVATATAEPFGLSVVEAMALARPVIVSAAGGHLETAGACASARTFPAGDEDGLSARLLELTSDPKECRAYGVELRELQRNHFDLGTHVSCLLSAYTA